MENYLGEKWRERERERERERGNGKPRNIASNPIATIRSVYR